MKEIGSEFWDIEPCYNNTEFLLSGRTALDFIIQDIMKTKKIDSVMLPSYCCHTMIEPFLSNKIDVRFYDVYYDSNKGLCADIPKALENEAFYHITYFGFSHLSGLNFDEIRNDYSVIIDDRTHSCMSEQQNDACDYCFESYRKWAGFYAIAKASKTNGEFRVKSEKTNEKYVLMRKQAFELKKLYVEDGQGNKNDFLSLFEEAEGLLEKDYKGYLAPDACVRQLFAFDTKAVKRVRRNNAKVLISELKDVKGMRLVFDELQEIDTPLFVPILVEKDRDKLKRYLIENKIYCPVHWPLSKCHNGISERARKIYSEELSIVCDQRYDVEDMLRIAAIIKEFYKNEELS